MSSKKTLLSHLGRRDYEKIPEEVSKKIEKVLNDADAKQSELKTLYNDSQKANSELCIFILNCEIFNGHNL